MNSLYTVEGVIGAVGGAVFAQTEKYLQAGMENEDFKSRKTKRDGCEKRNAFIETKTKCASNLIRKATVHLQNQSKTPSF